MEKENKKRKEKIESVLSQIGSQKEEGFNDIFNFKNKPVVAELEKKSATELWGKPKKK